MEARKSWIMVPQIGCDGWLGPASWFTDGAFLLCAHMVEGPRYLCGSLLINGTLISLMKAALSLPEYHPQGPPLKTNTLGIRNSAYEFWRDINIQVIAGNNFSTSSPTLIFLVCNHPSVYEVVLHCNFDLHFPDVCLEHHFLCLFTICMSSLEKSVCILNSVFNWVITEL